MHELDAGSRLYCPGRYSANEHPFNGYGDQVTTSNEGPLRVIFDPSQRALPVI
jgi:hypothetical protein